jgi:hypothetical protein
MGQVCIDPDATGLVAAYDMHPCDGVVKDLSGNGNDGTINGPVFEYTEIGGSMKTDEAVLKNIDLGNGFQTLTDLSISLWVTPYDISSITFLINYFESFTNGWGLRLTDSVTPGYSVIDISDDINDANLIRYQTDIKNNVAHHIVAQMDSKENKLWVDDALVGSGVLSTGDWADLTGILYILNRTDLSVQSPNCNISDVQVFNRALTQSEITALYQCGASAVNFKTDYGVCESVAAESATPPGTELSNSPFRIESGSFKISTDTIGGDTCKVIECVTAGVLQVPTAYFHGDETQAAYGSWEWWTYKGTTGTLPNVGFIGNQNTGVNASGFNGYSIRFSDTERFQLFIVTNGSNTVKHQTDIDFIVPNTWYKTKVTRSSDGEFTTYLNDVLVDVTGGFGTNPVTDTTYTTSKYIVLDLDAGDKIACAAPNGDCSIVKYQGVV